MERTSGRSQTSFGRQSEQAGGKFSYIGGSCISYRLTERPTCTVGRQCTVSGWPSTHQTSFCKYRFFPPPFNQIEACHISPVYMVLRLRYARTTPKLCCNANYQSQSLAPRDRKSVV